MPDSSVLSGYAATYANALNAGASDAQAHDAATRATGGGSYSTFNGSGGVSTFNAGDNSGYGDYRQTFEPQRSSFDNDNDFFKASNAYRIGLLDPFNLPGYLKADNNPYSFINIQTDPEKVGTTSNDLISRPTFITDPKTGNITRVDHTYSGDVTSLIPNLGGWRQTSSGDAGIGDVYGRQTSAYSAENKYQRGSQMGVRPTWYDENANKNWLTGALGSIGTDKIQSLLPGSKFYQPYYKGNNDLDSSLLTPSSKYSDIVSGYSDIDAQIRAAGEDPNNYTDAEKAQLREMIMYGG